MKSTAFAFEEIAPENLLVTWSAKLFKVSSCSVEQLVIRSLPKLAHVAQLLFKAFAQMLSHT